MIETVVSVELPADEKFEIKKQRILPLSGLRGGEKRISIVTGIHGDELEGQYVVFELARRIHENIENLRGIVDIYPAMNPMGIDTMMRGIPTFELDMNRIFPGSENGSMAEFTAARIVRDISGSDICFDLHASNMFLMEIPQIRISEESAEKLVPLAEKANVDFIWIHGAATVLQSTLAHSLNSIGTPTLVVEAGVGMRITKRYGEQIADGIMNVMREMGIWHGEVPKPRKPIISDSFSDVSYLNAPSSGIFVPEVSHGAMLRHGELIGRIIDPLSTTVLSEIRSPVDGFLFTIREYPVVDEGSLLGRILRENVL